MHRAHCQTGAAEWRRALAELDRAVAEVERDYAACRGAALTVATHQAVNQAPTAVAELLVSVWDSTEWRRPA